MFQRLVDNIQSIVDDRRKNKNDNKDGTDKKDKDPKSEATTPSTPRKKARRKSKDNNNNKDAEKTERLAPTEKDCSVMSVQKATTPQKKKKVKVLPRADNAEEVRQKWCQAIIDKGLDQLRTEFRGAVSSPDCDCTTFRLPENADKNRNPDVLCLEATRVRLPNNEYVHANYVGTVHNATRFICAQGPTEKTADSFWNMVANEKCEAIVMLCKPVESVLGPMCCSYFSEEAGSSQTIGDLKIFTHEKSAMKDFANIARFKISIKFLKKTDAPRHRVIIYQWTDWPQYGMPEPDLAAMNLLQSVRGSSNPVVVHCSEGVGRTGVLALIEQFYELMMLGQDCVDGTKVLRDLRAQRWGSVETDMQYLWVFRTLINFFVTRKTIDLSQNLLMWIDDYDAAHKKVVNVGALLYYNMPQEEKENPRKPGQPRLRPLDAPGSPGPAPVVPEMPMVTAHPGQPTQAGPPVLPIVSQMLGPPGQGGGF